MDLNAVNMFVGAVQSGSLSAAARRLNVPLPTLSRRLRELERQLNVQLFERSVRGTRLTDAGTSLYEHVSRGIEALRDAEQAIKSDQTRLKGQLRLSLPPTFEPWWDLLAVFQLRCPDVHLRIFTTDRRVDLIEDGIDVALRVGAIAHETMIARRILSYRHVLVASPALVARLGTPDSPQALHRFPCAVWSRGSGAVPAWRLGAFEHRPEPVLAINDYAHLRHRALAGDVITELPPFLAADAIRRNQLVALLPEHPLPGQELSLLYPSHRHPSAIVRAYLDFCQAQLPLALAEFADRN
ncbi:HTH-type transcriptional regulator DmlR [Paraburkholderia caffeinitolerans]|uniref:HTH-type transcriptional regulator DmlR n=1 Tax=Paraburkholderia caffeinitolerans TaxID=1723730 RepID=A0A6J5GNX2_9BURK|nr:LysR family transcriptional regulator [Paraburkholderia caffeinitolerans]CAB3801776.1 HTH-type transcriptional regulator DmlR [Paraburkholderia caffeinitolerans]